MRMKRKWKKKEFQPIRFFWILLIKEREWMSERHLVTYVNKMSVEWTDPSRIEKRQSPKWPQRQNFWMPLLKCHSSAFFVTVADKMCIRIVSVDKITTQLIKYECCVLQFGFFFFFLSGSCWKRTILQHFPNYMAKFCCHTALSCKWWERARSRHTHTHTHKWMGLKIMIRKN